MKDIFLIHNSWLGKLVCLKYRSYRYFFYMLNMFLKRGHKNSKLKRIMIFQDSDHSVRIINSCLMYVFWALQWQLWWGEVSTKKPPRLWLAIWPWPSTPGETPQEQQAPEEDQSDRQRTLRPGHLSPGRQV